MFIRKQIPVAILLLLVFGCLSASAQTARPAQQLMLLASEKSPSTDKSTKPAAKPALGAGSGVIWREPTDIASRNLFYGPGGPDRLPSGKLKFIKEDKNGVNPKFNVVDEAGVKWGVKFGNEARPETAATRLVWAVGYFTNEDYYLADLNVGQLRQKMTRGQNLIEGEKLNGARFKRHNTGEKQIADWSWDKNPFVGTKELDGLKIMMEIICNVDLKGSNQHVYATPEGEQRYIAADLGSSFGKAGKTMFYTKGKLKDFQSLPLIKNAGPDYIDFWRFKQIPREHAKWIAGYLAQLSDRQISDAFRAAQFSPDEVEGFTRKVREKINELQQL
jgi:hypothetical protein